MVLARRAWALWRRGSLTSAVCRDLHERMSAQGGGVSSGAAPGASPSALVLPPCGACVESSSSMLLRRRLIRGPLWLSCRVPAAHRRLPSAFP